MKGFKQYKLTAVEEAVLQAFKPTGELVLPYANNPFTNAEVYEAILNLKRQQLITGKGGPLFLTSWGKAYVNRST